MTDLELIQEILDKPIAFHKIFFNVTKDVKIALFLSQLFYWSKKMKHDWFYKSRESWEEETGLTRYEQEAAKKKLISLKLLQCQLKGMPAKQYFKFDFDQLIRLAKQYYQLSGEKSPTCKRKSPLHVSGKLADMSGEKSPTIYRTENTTENTTEKKNTTSNEVVEENLKFSSPSVPYEKIVKIYHEKLPQLPKVEVISNTRKAKIKTCWTQKPTEQFKPQDLSWWQNYFEYVGRVPFLVGENTKGWRANFDFLINFNSMVKVMEGGYEGGNNVPF